MSKQLKKAIDNLKQLREDFKDQPDLLAIYEPSALYVVKVLENQDPNYYGMWETFKDAIEGLTVEGDIIHVSDLMGAMEIIESDESH
jgi:hypothetical protein